MTVIKNAENTINRIIKMRHNNDVSDEMISNCIMSLIKSRDNRIKKLERTQFNRALVPTNTRIRGALKSCIKKHGPITSQFIDSATKRVFGSILHEVITGHNS